MQKPNDTNNTGGDNEAQSTDESSSDQGGGQDTQRTDSATNVRHEADETGSSQEDEGARSEDPGTDEPDPGNPGDGSDGTSELPDWAQKKIGSLNKEAASYRRRLREAEEKLTQASSAEEMQDIVSKLKEDNEELERKVLVGKVSATHRLPDDLAKLLQGKTEDELSEHAKVLARYVPSGRSADDLQGGLSPDEDTDGYDPVQAARNARTRRW